MSKEPLPLANPSGVSRRAAEIVVVAFTLAVGITVIVASRKLGASWASDGPEAGYFPFYIGVLICIGSVINFLACLKQPSGKEVPMFVNWQSLGRVVAVLLPAAIYVAGIYVVGIYVSSFLYIAGFMIFMGRYRAWKAFAVSGGVTIVLFLMFEIWFKVLLPKGAYNILGYFGH